MPPLTSVLPLADAGEERHAFTGPIAIIGMSCRLPGDASNPSRLWDMLASGRCAWSEVPEDRFNMDAFRHCSGHTACTTNTAGGHFLDGDLAGFDADFFNMSALELKAIDPQQRLLLEIAYEAFEDAGLSIRQLRGSNTGVYVGQWASDYHDMLTRDSELPALYQLSGTGTAISSNRLSYFFDLRGPSSTVDTGCSSSLVALHNAVQSLRLGETDQAFVGGVNLLLDPQRFINLSRLNMISDEGRSFSFDDRANGFGRGEGCVGLFIKRLTDAERAGDPVRAVIRHTVLNQDGRTPGIMVPNGEAQMNAINRAYKEAGLDRGPDAVEAHGTGTVVGDHIEVEAIASALANMFGSDRDPIPISSIKGNVGHTESAAGLAGVLKAVLMLENQTIAPQAGFERSNPKLLLEQRNLYVPTSQEKRALRRISVNSFGYGGTNAHLVLDHVEIPDTPEVHRVLASAHNDDKEIVTSKQRLFVLSAASEQSFQRVAEDFQQYVAKHSERNNPEQWIDRLAYTINRRSIHQYRTTFLAANIAGVREQLSRASETVNLPQPQAHSPRVAYIFSGQGAQYYDMGRELIGTWPVFTASLHRAANVLQTLGCPWGVMEELQRDADSSQVDDPAYGQPLTTTIQMALCDTLTALGLQPDAVVGHSSGEIAAAYAAGALSFDDAIITAYHRGRLTSEYLSSMSNSSAGAMLAIGLSAEAVRDVILNGNNLSEVVIACYNSPSSITVSGEMRAIKQLKQILDDKSIFNRLLRTNGAAYHSQLMKPIEKPYYNSLGDIRASQTMIPMVSSVSGSSTGCETLGREYWIQNLMSPVRFEQAVVQLCLDAKQLNFALEIGPHATLAAPFKQTLKSFESGVYDIKYLNCLSRKVDASSTLLTCVGELFAAGVPLEFHLANNGFRQIMPRPLSDLPPYPFDHSRRYWHESRASKAYRHRKFSPHELLGSLQDESDVVCKWRNYLNIKHVPWLSAHMVQGRVVFPGAAYLAMALEAIRRHSFSRHIYDRITGYLLANVSFGKALVLPDEETDTEIVLSLTPQSRTAKQSWAEWMEFQVHSISEGKSWTEHCRGQIRVCLQDSAAVEADADQRLIDRSTAESLHSVSPSWFYNAARRNGIEFRKPFTNYTGISTGPGVAVTVTECPDLDDYPGRCTYPCHPGTFDTAVLQGVLAIEYAGRTSRLPLVPSFIEELYVSCGILHNPGAQLTSHTVEGNEISSYDVLTTATAHDRRQPLIRIRGLTVVKLPGDTPLRATAPLTHRQIWVPYCQRMTRPYLDSMYELSSSCDSAGAYRELLNELTSEFCKAAMELTPKDLVAEDHRRLYYEWMRDVARQSNRDGPARRPSSEPSHPVEEAVRRVGTHMHAFLTGELDPISLLTRDKLLTRLYTEPGHQRCFQQIKVFCKALGMQKPGLKIIEVGGGTASVALPILQSCNGESQSLISMYRFTDISAGFFDNAQRILASFADVVAYQTLDLEKDVALQGFEKASYDVVVASNVLHATESIDQTLSHVKSLLSPGGHLILMEITGTDEFLTFAYGVFPGWWAGVHEGRTRSPLLTVEQWSRKLTEHGFEDVQPYFSDHGEPEKAMISVFVATLAEQAPIATPAARLSILGLPDSSSAGPLSNLRCRWSETRQVEQIDLEHGMLEMQHRYETLVILPEVCDALALTPGRTLFAAVQRSIISSKIVLMLTLGGGLHVAKPNAAVSRSFARAFRLEHGDVKLITLDLDTETPDDICSSIIDYLLTDTTFEGDLDYTLNRGQLHIARVIADDGVEEYIRGRTGSSDLHERPFLTTGTTMSVELDHPGLLETFHWKPSSVPDGPLDPDSVRIELKAASVNYRDMLVATNQLSGHTAMYNDCSGVIVACGENVRSRFRVGDRICGYNGSSYSNYPVMSAISCCHISEHMSFAAAASIPTVWGTAYYSLVEIARLQKGQRVLIHSGAGAVGQAAISLAQYLGADIYATADTDEEINMIANKFGIPSSNLFSSRTSDFKQGIRSLTGYQGVDVILSSLTGEAKRASCELLASFGCFIEIGKKDLLDNALLPTKFLLKNVTVRCVDFLGILEERPEHGRDLLRKVIDLLDSGLVQAPNMTIYPISDIEQAFRLVASGKHTGGVILTVEPEQTVLALPDIPPPAVLSSDGTYVVAGGLGSLGRCVLSWLADRGARSVVAIQRPGQTTAHADAMTKEMHSRGVAFRVKVCDISSRKELAAAVSEIPSPVRGVINAAMSLQDVSYEDMTYEQWQQCLKPKVQGTWNLHECLPKALDFFICFSSIAALTGNNGQSNYAAACGFQDSFASYRQALGYNTYSVNIGHIIDAGYVSENRTAEIASERNGYGSATKAELLANLDFIVTTAFSPGQSQIQTQNSIGLLRADADRAKQPWLRSQIFAHLWQGRQTPDRVQDTAQGQVDPIEAVRAASSREEVQEAICTAILNRLSRLLLTPLENLSAQRSLDSYGVDSLVAVELRTWMGKVLEADIPLLVLRDTKDIKHLARLALEDSKLVLKKGL
ncbi:putative polyketide synthase [Myriangium duriaei CBS 260.36]|uniref:Polyketide synthase n=1 Tax=Myriangium duriaei CBS 260.36 TaxID=1168546 RepID=A0A9P4IZT2_9PEZI|nr:putative polyketide synthase [Myriangium duriaei CBS 260.36]